jgi:hypothetical protein
LLIDLEPEPDIAAPVILIGRVIWGAHANHQQCYIDSAAPWRH